MASPITSIGFTAITNAQTSPSTSSDVASLQQSKPSISESPSNPVSPQKDTVQISQEALNLSKDLKGKSAIQASAGGPLPDIIAQSSVDSKGSGLESLKSFPPFIGNNNELKQLKQTSPALYREILKMIVPPPLDLTYYEQQILKGSNIDGKTT